MNSIIFAIFVEYLSKINATKGELINRGRNTIKESMSGWAKFSKHTLGRQREEKW